MRIGFFTDTYFPQVSGVATSIKTLKEELVRLGHEVYIFTTTDPQAEDLEKNIVRMPSVPFISFKDRRIVVRGMWFAYQVAKDLELDLIHVHTEFGAGALGQMVSNRLEIPAIYTYHTSYEDYLHYIGNGKVVRPSHVKHFIRFFANHVDGIVCPSERVVETMKKYEVRTPLRVIPTGIDIEKFKRNDITKEMTQEIRDQLGIKDSEIMLLSLSRISFEKNIQAIIKGMPRIIEELPNARLVIVGKGPYREDLEELSTKLGLADYIQFTGEVPNDEVAVYYKAANYFVSASTSETQGLTYTEAISAGTQCVVEGNPYLDKLFDDPSLGVTFSGDEEFAEALIDYVNAKIPKDERVLARKLYSVSSVHFGEEMERFYQDTLLSFENREPEETSTRRKMKIKLASLRNLDSK